MTFEEYMNAVIEYFQRGGVSWGASYMRMLKAHRADLYDQIEGRVSYDPQVHPANLAGFIYVVFTSWGE